MKCNYATAVAFLGAILPGCAVLPFAPAIAHVAPRMLFPNHDSASSHRAPALAPDPQIESAVAAGSAGDTGIGIPDQDRVAFAPAAPGSIPLRVAAADLVADVKARTVGDMVTVNVVESITGESKAATSLANKRSIEGGIPNFFTFTEGLGKYNPMLNLSSMINSTANNSTDGQGDMTAADTFSANVSAVVTAVNPSGTLSIKGERQLQINGEDDTIQLSGVVRPEDINSDDIVLSSEVADLEVSLTGRGQIRDKQGDGLGTRLFDWLWLF
ncbi:MAG: flagellar basal body L-ring protein FlgH [Deltaproteobacteria bacterium]|nr:flagellar basal body L-ring protein FlgH [Deltaproteobacteria bacterium]